MITIDQRRKEQNLPPLTGESKVIMAYLATNLTVHELCEACLKNMTQQECELFLGNIKEQRQWADLEEEYRNLEEAHYEQKGQG